IPAIDRWLSVLIQSGRKPIQECVDLRWHSVELESNSVLAHLLMIADDDDFLAQTKIGEPQDITLACLIDDDHVKISGAQLKAFECARDRHDPYGDRLVALGETLPRFLFKLSDELPSAFTNFPIKS